MAIPVDVLRQQLLANPNLTPQMEEALQMRAGMGMSQAVPASEVPPMAPAPVEVPSVTAPSPMGQTFTPAAEASPRTQALQGYEKIREGMMKEAEAGAKRGAREAGYMYGAQRELETLQQQNAAKQAEATRQLDEELASNRKLVEDYTQSKTDPRRFYKNLSTGQKIAAAFSMMAGGIGGAMTGQRNYAADIITSAANEDIEAQKAEIAQKKGAIDQSNNALSFYRARMGDERQALNAAEASILLRAKLNGEALAAQMTNEVQKANLLKGLGELDVKIADKLGELDKRSLENVELRRKLSGKGGGGEKLTAAATKEISDLGSALGLIDKLEEDFQSKTGLLSGATQFLPATDASKYLDSRDLTAQTVGVILEGGKLTAEDYERYKNLLPSPGDSQARAKQKLENMRDQIVAKRNSQIKTYGEGGFNTGTIQPTLTDQMLIDWAQKNPQNPKAQKILNAIGTSK